MGRLLKPFSVGIAAYVACATPVHAADLYRGLTGVEVVLRPGIGMTPADSPVRAGPNAAQVIGGPDALWIGARPWGMSAVGQLAVGYRFRPGISAGLRGGFRIGTGVNLADGSTHLVRTGWDGGLYVRGYPIALTRLARYLDPWVSAGVGYQRDTQSSRKTVTVADQANVVADVTLAHHAVALPMGVGVDVRLGNRFSLGPSFELAAYVPIAGCTSTKGAGFTTPTYCSNRQPEVIDAAAYFAWSAGLDFKLTLGR